MPPEAAGDGEILEFKKPSAAGSRSRRFLSTGLSIFQSKRSSSSSTKHRRGASLDIPANCSSHWQYKFRDALLCEPPLKSTQCKQPSVQRKPKASAPDGGDKSKSSILSHSEATSQDKQKFLSRWLRSVGRFSGKNRVREDYAPDMAQAASWREHKPLIPRKCVARKYNWVSCEDLACVSAQKEQQSGLRHDELLIKPVLEPVQFATTEYIHSSHRIEEATHVVAASKSGAQPATDAHSDEGGGIEIKTSARLAQECETVVAQLRCKTGKEQGVVATEARLLAKDYPTARATLKTLGAIVPLVSMLDSTSSFCTHTSLRALYTLAIGNDVNKGAIVDAGAVPKMLTVLETSSSELPLQEAVLANLLSLSALDRNKPVIGAAGAVTHLVEALRIGGDQVQRQALRALYNLSLARSNIKVFVDADAATAVMAALRMKTSTSGEKALAILANLVAAPVGRRSVTESAEAVETLIAVLRRCSSKCQERAAYLLMVIALQSFGHRQAISQKGAIPVLLEVSLMGSALAQKRCVRVLECLREDRRPMSAPLEPPACNNKNFGPIPKAHQQSQISELVTHMVQQSLEQNLQRIVRRAKLPASMAGHTRGSTSLSGCSSSNSQTY